MYKSLKKGFFNNKTPIPKDMKKTPKVLPANLREQVEKEAIMIVASSPGYDSGEIASITVNDNAPVIEKNENNHLRGLHIVIVNPTSGKVEVAKAFDTYKSSNKLDEFLANSEFI